MTFLKGDRQVASLSMGFTSGLLAATLMQAVMTHAQTPFIYPAAHTVDQVDDYFGTKVADPYRWMEDVDSPAVKAWVDAQNALTRSFIAQVPVRDKIHQRLMALNSFERYTLPARRGNRYFYTHNEGLQNQNVMFWQEGLTGEPKVLLDPNTMSADGTIALNGFDVTDDGRLAAYAISEAGSDWLTWHVRDVATGKDLPDVIHWSKFSNAGWMHDGSGFFYSGYDAPKPGPDGKIPAESLKETNYFHKLYFHKLGTPQSEDKLIFERPDDKELSINGSVSDDGEFLAIYQAKGTSPFNELAILPLQGVDLARPATGLIRLITKADATYSVIDNDGSYFWLQTTLDAPNGKVISVDLKQADRAHWKTIIPESHNALESVSMVDNTLIASYLADAQSRVELHTRDGALIAPLTLPAIGTTSGFGGRRTDTETFFSFTNFTTPPTIYRLDLKTRAASIYREPKLLFNPKDFETRQVFATSKDGTKVPIFLSYRKGLKMDGTAPTLLYAYGGFNISMVPAFSSGRVLWMEMGGVYAQAVLRGGGEYGEAWHQAGTTIHKQNVFDDFIASAEYLIATKVTSTPHLAIQGGSNGGLLMGAVETQRPELFGAVLADVGVMDMLRFDKFTIGWAWKSDYGGPSDDKADFEAIYKYSPLHNVRAGVKYPPTLITTADHDDRVFPAHSFKYAATMQAAIAKENLPAGPVLIRVETRAGHGGGMPLSKRMDVSADQLAFLVRELRMKPVLPGTR
jgi:prolyl oligopeptidase